MRKGFVCGVWLIGQLTCFGLGDQPTSPRVAGQEPKLKEVAPEQQKQEKRATEEEIRKLIASLAEIKDPYVGLSPTLSGRAFAAVTGTHKIGVMVLPNRRLQNPEALKRLVQLGPEALPQLLQALNDETPSKLKIEPKGTLNVGFPEDGKPYTVRVGDICYVAIGQIICQPYHCVEYIPTGIISITSPVEDQELCKKVRGEWAKKVPAENLRERLLKQYQTKPVFNGKSLDDWSEGSDLQIEAALRLLYYYPKHGVPLVVARLKALDVAKPGQADDAWMLREVRNGVRTVEFIKAVVWCEHPEIRAALADVKKRTTDQQIAELLEEVGMPKVKP